MTTSDLLAFEAEWLNRPHDGRYETAVRKTFGVSVTRHLQRVNTALDTVAALEADALTVRVLQGRREAARTGLGSHGGVRHLQ